MPTLLFTIAAGFLFTSAAMASSATSNNAAQEDAEAQGRTAAGGRISELRYRDHLEVQHQLHRYMPSEPRLVDMWFRAGYRGMSEPERDAYVPRGWAVAIRSRSVNVAVPMRRGAYFSLPEIQASYDERGDIMLNDGARPWLGIWWTLRVPPGQRMAYADILGARAQIAGVQAKISAFAYPLKSVKRAKYDGIKACFHDATGAILVGGIAVADATEGNCKVLFNDRPLEALDASVEFSGPLDVVSFIDRRYYSDKRQ